MPNFLPPIPMSNLTCSMSHSGKNLLIILPSDNCLAMLMSSEALALPFPRTWELLPDSKRSHAGKR